MKVVITIEDVGQDQVDVRVAPEDVKCVGTLAEKIGYEAYCEIVRTLKRITAPPEYASHD